MLVSVRPAAQKILKMLRADRDCQSKANRGPQRIAPADPIPKAKHPLGLDAKLAHQIKLCRDGGKMIADRLLAKPCRHARACAGGVRHGLLRRERLGGDDEQGARQIEVFERIGQISAIDVGNKMRARPIAAIGRQGARRHRGPKVRAANADVDDIRKPLAG